MTEGLRKRVEDTYADAYVLLPCTGLLPAAV
jgi:hypothetical protein